MKTMIKKMVKKADVSLMAASLLMLVTVTSWAEVSVIVHPSNTASLNKNDIKRIFLGKKKSFPGGGDVLPVDQKEGAAVRTTFSSTILKKSDQQVKTYWAQMLFTGKGTPPKQVDSGSGVKDLVSKNPAIIGYVDSADVDGTVKVVFKF